MVAVERARLLSATRADLVGNVHHRYEECGRKPTAGGHSAAPCFDFCPTRLKLLPVSSPASTLRQLEPIAVTVPASIRFHRSGPRPTCIGSQTLRDVHISQVTCASGPAKRCSNGILTADVRAQESVLPAHRTAELWSESHPSRGARGQPEAPQRPTPWSLTLPVLTSTGLLRHPRVLLQLPGDAPPLFGRQAVQRPARLRLCQRPGARQSAALTDMLGRNYQPLSPHLSYKLVRNVRT